MTPLEESTLDPDDAVFDQVVPSGPASRTSSPRDRSSASSTSRATRPSTRCSTTRAISTSATARPTPSARRARIYLTTGTRLISSEGRPMLTIVADTCGRHDTLGGACSAESNQVRYALDKKYMHNCRDSFLLALVALRSRHEQARHRQQHQLLHERAGHARGRAVVRRRRVGRRDATSRCAPRWTCWC